MKKLIQKVRFMMLKNGVEKAKYLKKHNILMGIGEHCLYQPYKIPMDPKLIIFHNNVYVAADVKFVTHDASRNMLAYKYKRKYSKDLGFIEIKDNVFIGLGSIIMSNVVIEENVIVAAGSVVTKSVPKNSVVAGVPARIIGTFDQFNDKKVLLTDKFGSYQSYDELVNMIWNNKEVFKKDYLKK